VKDLSGIAFLLVAIPLAAQVPESRAASRPASGDVRFELLAPGAESRPAESRAAPPVAVIRITNAGAAPVVLWPFVSIEVLDARGQVVKPTSFRGRFGRRKQSCFLEAVQFATLEPGKSIERPVTLNPYMHDPQAIVGWKLAPAAYTLRARYAYSRSEFVARCKLDCEFHADATKPWNMAVEVEREASLQIAVK
jgi:hypothetical protein